MKRTSVDSSTCSVRYGGSFLSEYTANSPLRIVPLGGLGEIGKNMLAIEYEDDIVVVDCGVMFPEDNMPGVSLVLPDVSYLINNQDKVRGILITHGHEDHIGALPYILPRLNVPVYASRLAHGLIEVKLKEHNILTDTDLFIITPGTSIPLGCFDIEFFRVSHSIPDAMGIAISTPAGLVIHTGDFKIDHTPVDGKRTDLAELARYGDGGVLLLLSDSTYAELDGYTPSEQVVGGVLDQIIGDAQGRVLVATFASLISRMQQVINAAIHYDKKISIVGRSMVSNFAMAVDLGYINAPPDVVLPLNQALKLEHNKLVIMTTGSQGEPSSALVRIANGNHRQLEIVPGDTVIMSSTPVPGNEKGVARSINNLIRRGARVMYDKIATVHVHGHSSKEELKIMLNLTKPQFFVPIHGEYRGLVAHADLATQMGVAGNHIFVLEDGDVLELNRDGGEVVDHVPAGNIFLDGTLTLEAENLVLRDRSLLSKNGIVVMVISLDKETGVLLSDPEVFSTGFTEADDKTGLLPRAARAVFESIEDEVPIREDHAFIDGKVREIVGRLLFKETGRRPIIKSMIVEV